METYRILRNNRILRGNRRGKCHSIRKTVGRTYCAATCEQITSKHNGHVTVAQSVKRLSTQNSKTLTDKANTQTMNHFKTDIERICVCREIEPSLE